MTPDEFRTVATKGMIESDWRTGKLYDIKTFYFAWRNTGEDRFRYSSAMETSACCPANSTDEVRQKAYEDALQRFNADVEANCAGKNRTVDLKRIVEKPYDLPLQS